MVYVHKCASHWGVVYSKEKSDSNVKAHLLIEGCLLTVVHLYCGTLHRTNSQRYTYTDVYWYRKGAKTKWESSI